MDNLHLVTGYLGYDHIAAADQGAFNAALIGTGQFVLDKGKVFEAQVISNNQVRIFDGELMIQGRFVRLEPDTYVDLTIENGAQGVLRNDLIAVRYTKDTLTGVEGVNLVVIKGTAVESNPVDPEYTEADITNGDAVLHEYPLWRIPIDGLNVGTPVALYGELFTDSMKTLPDIRAQVNQIHSEVDAKLEPVARILYGTYDGDGEESRTISLDFTPKAVLVMTDYGAMNGDETTSNRYCYGGLALPDAPVMLSELVAVEIVTGGFVVHKTSQYSKYYVRTNEKNCTYHYVAFC